MYRKEAIHRTEIKRSLLAAKGFNTNLVHFLPPYHVLSLVTRTSDVLGAQFPMRTAIHLKRNLIPRIIFLKITFSACSYSERCAGDEVA